MDLAKLEGKIDLTNQRLDAVILSLQEAQKSRKYIITTTIAAMGTFVTLLAFAIRLLGA